jgi:hypothetical protein
MVLHLLKLCVGCNSIADLEMWIEQERQHSRRRGAVFQQRHTTRMYPKRAAEIIGQGSLYWVIKSQIACRQTILDIEQFVGPDGISRCDLVMGKDVIPVAPRPYRPFQGWRYLDAKDAPRDLVFGQDGNAPVMPETMRRELASLGLL